MGMSQGNEKKVDLNKLISEFSKLRAERLASKNKNVTQQDKGSRQLTIRWVKMSDCLQEDGIQIEVKKNCDVKKLVSTAPVAPEKSLIKCLNMAEDSNKTIAVEMEMASDAQKKLLIKPSINTDLVYQKNVTKYVGNANDSEKNKWYYKCLLGTTGYYKGCGRLWFYDALESQPFGNFEGNIVLLKNDTIYCSEGDREKNYLKELAPFNSMYASQNGDEYLIPDFIKEYIRPLVEKVNVVLWRPNQTAQMIKIAIVRVVVNAGYLFKSMDFYKESESKFEKLFESIGLNVPTNFRITDSYADHIYEQFIKGMENFAPIKYSRVFNILETVCDGNVSTFNKVAKLWAKLYMGKKFMKNIFNFEQSDIVILEANNTFYLKQFMAASFDYEGQHSKEYNHCPKCLSKKMLRQDETVSGIVLPNVLLKTKKIDNSISHFSLADLTKNANVPKMLTAKFHGNLLNVSCQDSAGDCDFRRLKHLLSGDGLTYTNSIFGEQIFQTSNIHCLITHTGSKVSNELKEAGITYDRISLADNIPVNQVAFGDGDVLTKDELFFVNVVLALWGTHCLLKDGFDKDSEDNIFDSFITECCDIVPVEKPNNSKDELKATVKDSTAWTTIEAMYKKYYFAATGQELGYKLNRDYFKRHNIQTNSKLHRCDEIVQRDYDKGYREELGELPKNAANFCIGVIIRDKKTIEDICTKKNEERLQPASKDERKQFYENFAEAIKTTISELTEGIK